MVLRAMFGVVCWVLAWEMGFSGEFSGIIRKVEGNKIVLERPKKGKKTELVVFSTSVECKVFTGKYNPKTQKIDAGEEVAGGLKNSLFQKTSSSEIHAWVITDPEEKNILELRVFQVPPKKKKFK